MDAIGRYWQRHFPGTAPVGWALQSSFPDRWVRLHSLPGSKQYPDGKKHRAIIAERALALAHALLSDTGPYYMLANVYAPEPGLPFAVTQDWRYHGAELSQSFSCLEDSADQASQIVVFTGQTERLSRGFEAAVLGIAEERSARCIWVSPKRPAAFAPYAGGFDLITAVPDDVATFKAQFKRWLSKHPDGF